MKHNVPEFSYIRHGWSYNLLWVCLVMFTFSGVVLIASSRNHKGLKARSFSQGGHGERGSPLWKDLGASKDQSVEGCGLASATQEYMNYQSSGAPQAPVYLKVNTSNFQVLQRPQTSSSDCCSDDLILVSLEERHSVSHRLRRFIYL